MLLTYITVISLSFVDRFGRSLRFCQLELYEELIKIRLKELHNAVLSLFPWFFLSLYLTYPCIRVVFSLYICVPRGKSLGNLVKTLNKFIRINE